MIRIFFSKQGISDKKNVTLEDTQRLSDYFKHKQKILWGNGFNMQNMNILKVYQFTIHWDKIQLLPLTGFFKF